MSSSYYIIIVIIILNLSASLLNIVFFVHACVHAEAKLHSGQTLECHKRNSQLLLVVCVCIVSASPPTRAWCTI